MFYSLARRLLFLMDPETAHYRALQTLSLLDRLKLAAIIFPPQVKDPIELMGLSFPNRVGLAAGFDRNADYVAALAHLGFGFIEVGSVTPEPWAGKPKPRIFRLAKNNAIINRIGFYNKGLEHVVNQLQKVKYDGVLGVNLGKNVPTPNEQAVQDYLVAMQAVYPYADYMTLNLSSPNTPGIRELQGAVYLKGLLTALKNVQAQLATQHQKYVPLLVKVAPDFSGNEVEVMAETLLACEIDGLIATNTTVARDTLVPEPGVDELGGLSGAPLLSKATAVCQHFHVALQGKIPIIGLGGVQSPEDAIAKLNAGASLIQLYTGLIYQGPGLIPRLAVALRDELDRTR